jgi:hypothetical protein
MLPRMSASASTASRSEVRRSTNAAIESTAEPAAGAARFGFMPWLLFATLLLAAAPQAAQPGPASASFNPRAAELFERDWVLMLWAVQRFDADRDGAISAAEAQPAAEVFRDIADGNRDGRVTPYEYQRAREFIVARY